MSDRLLRLVPAWIDWLTAIAIVALGTVALAIVKAVAQRRLKRIAPLTENQVDDVLLGMIVRTKLAFLVVPPLVAALALVKLPAVVERVGRGYAILVFLFQAGIWASQAVRVLVERRLPPTGESNGLARRTEAKMVELGVRLVLWTVLALVALDNLGVNITALVAGLGVGGVAIALATQNILGDLFSSVSIVLDKPFLAGDFIVVGDFMGTVEQIGIKTTRMRSLGGEQIVMSNADLLQSRVRNYKRMTERRVLFRLGVVYQTSPEKLEAIPALLRQIVEAQTGVRFDRAHFVSYGDFALLFEIVYYVLSPDYTRYMDVQQGLNLAIFRRFAEAGIEFAYPTQTLFVSGATAPSEAPAGTAASPRAPGAPGGARA